MIITPQPRLVEPKYENSTVQEHVTNPSYILHEKAQQYYWEGRAPLSIKAFFSGQALYTLGKGRYAVDDAPYLIVNHAQVTPLPKILRGATHLSTQLHF